MNKNYLDFNTIIIKLVLLNAFFVFVLNISCKERHYNREVDNNSSITQTKIKDKVEPQALLDNLNAITGKVIGISDGDTFSLLFDNGFKVKVRLNGIDCPEKKQPYSQKAKQEISAMIFDKEVKVEYKDKDRYGRVLGEVYVDELHVNKEMVKRGLAWHYKKYSDNMDLARLEIEARNNQIGLWEDPNPIPPWEYRKN